MARILIVEDDDHIRTALRLMFEGEGFDVDDAPTGEVGVALFARMAADVAIVDVMLPGMSGFETCQQLRDTSDLPIVIVSARDETVDVVLGLESGADDYVTKPFVPEELLRTGQSPLASTTRQECQGVQDGWTCTSCPTKASCATATVPNCTSPRPSSVS